MHTRRSSAREEKRMPRFYVIKAVPGCAVVDPHDQRPGRFIGRAGGKLNGEPVEQLVQHDPHTLDAIAKGDLERVGEPVIAESHAAAAALIAARKKAPAPKKGDAQ
jgi:hypothetical protein